MNNIGAVIIAYVVIVVGLLGYYVHVSNQYEQQCHNKGGYMLSENEFVCVKVDALIPLE